MTEKLPQPLHGSRADVLARVSFVNVGYLRNPTASKRDEVCDQLAQRIDELSRLAGSQGHDIIEAAMLNGWNFTYMPPDGAMGDEWNRAHAWAVKRSDAFGAPYGLDSGEKTWYGSSPREALERALKAMAHTRWGQL